MTKSFVILTSVLCIFTIFINAFSITGVHAGVNNETGARPFRQNIKSFKHSGPAWDLYILALQRFMATDQANKYSYYKISGIHGYPANVPWDGVVGAAGGVGYCEHGSILFPVWHRPYVALFEQKVWELAQQVAAEYPSSRRAQYTNAAISLRVPYWDWSLDPGLPDVTTKFKISVNSPTGWTTIDNPLYAYRFHPLSAADLPYLSQYSTTVREPNLQTLQSQNDLVNQGLINTASYWHDNAYLLFSSISDWSSFANSVEQLHGGIHNYVGGPTSPNNGHMTFLWYSAFDPIFWLHHAQVDRLVAMWQAIHPYAYIEPQASTTTTYYVPAGTTQSITYPLVPFRRNAKGQFHTGETVRRLKTFGYSYPELVYWSKTGSNVWTFAKEVTAIVNGLYNPRFAKLSNESGSWNLTNTNSFRPVGSSLVANWEWRFRVDINRSVLTSLSALLFFHGNSIAEVPPVRLTQDPSLIGSQILLSPYSNATTAAVFATNSANIPLTQTILSSGNLDTDSAILWIKQNIFWRSLQLPSSNVLPSNSSQKSDTEIHLGQIPANAVTLTLQARQVAQPREETSFPQYGTWIVYGTETLVGNGGLVKLEK